MVRQRPLPVNQWILNNSKDLVQKLERKNGIFTIDYSDPLKLKDFSLFTPEGIAVYRVVKGIEKRNDEYFFTCIDGKDLNHAYLSKVSPSENAIKYMLNGQELLQYPWYSNVDSSAAFYRLIVHPNIDKLEVSEPSRFSHPFETFNRP